MLLNSTSNILPTQILHQVQTTLFSSTVPWFSITTDYIRTGRARVGSFSWEHWAWQNGQPSSNLGEMLHVVAIMALEKTGQSVQQVLRIRLGLHTATPHNDLGGAHIDHVEPHRVALIYLNDSDGDTVFYQQRYDPSSGLGGPEYFAQVLAQQTTRAATSTPEENKLVWFDGFHYHSSTSPMTTARRLVININYTAN